MKLKNITNYTRKKLTAKNSIVFQSIAEDCNVQSRNLNKFCVK